MFGYIYRIYCPRYAAFYIGQKKGPFNENYYGSGKIISRILRKYGSDGLIRDILFIAGSQEELDDYEIYHIRVHKDFGFRMLNILGGGRGLAAGDKRPSWVVRKIIAGNKGKKRPPHRPGQTAKIVAKTTGLKRTKEFCDRISRLSMGRVASPEARANMRAARLGRTFKPLTPEHRAKIAESNRRTKAANKLARQVGQAKGS